jgi:hypothetical protein
MKRFGFTLALAMTATSLLACPMCNTETGKQVREGIFGPDFYTNVLVTVAPFPVVLALCALVYWILPDPKKRRVNGT